MPMISTVPSAEGKTCTRELVPGVVVAGRSLGNGSEGRRIRRTAVPGSIAGGLKYEGGKERCGTGIDPNKDRRLYTFDRAGARMTLGTAGERSCAFLMEP